MLAISVTCLVALTVFATPTMARPAASSLEAPGTPGAAQTDESGTPDAPKASKITPLQARLFEQALLKTQRRRLASAIRAIGAGDVRIEQLLKKLPAEQLPDQEAQASTGEDPAGPKSGPTKATPVLEVPTYAAPLFLQLSAIDRSLQEVTSRIEKHNRGSDFGLGIAAFPVQSSFEFVDSWGSARSGGRSHKGTDIMNPRGTPILAIENGVIERHSSHHLGGLAIYLRGDSGALYYYAHVDSFGPQIEGQRVKVGEVIAANGDTGNARGTPHLHFQYSPTGDDYGWIDPYPLLESLQHQGWDPGRISAQRAA
jgi:murein DD-endopeptidase MepM/ murein hydrolase activator NlpD